MAVAFDAKTATWKFANGVATATVSNLTVGSGANRGLLIGVMFGSISTGMPTGLTATWDSGGTNQAMTQVPNTLLADSVLSASSAIYGLLAPTSGNKSLVLSWTGNQDIEVCGLSLTGVDQTSIAVAFPHGNTNKASGASPNTVTITSAVNNWVFACHAQNFSTWGAISDTTLAQDLNSPNIGVVANYAAGAATKTMTAAFTGTGAWNSIGCDVLAAGGVAAIAAKKLIVNRQTLVRAAHW